MSDKVFWYEKNGEKRCGFTAAELKALALSGEIDSSCLIWKEGTKDWIPATSVRGLLPAEPLPAPLQDSIPPIVNPVPPEPEQETTAEPPNSPNESTNSGLKNSINQKFQDLNLVNKWQNLDLINRWKSLSLVQKILCIAAIISAFAIGLFNLLFLLVILLPVLWFIALFKPSIVRANTRMQATKRFAVSFVLVLVGVYIVSPTTGTRSNSLTSNIFSHAVEMMSTPVPSKNPRYTPIQASNGLYGYINTEGKVVIAPQFKKAGKFTDDGLAKVIYEDKTPHDGVEDGKSGFINADGVLVIELQNVKFYDTDDTIGDFSNGLAWVLTKERKYGYINTEGKMVIEPYEFRKVGYFSKNGLARVSLSENRYGYINREGDLILNFDRGNYSDFGGGDFADNGLALQYGHGSSSFERVVLQEGLGASRTNDKGFINEKGDVVIKEDGYLIDGGFSKNGLACIKVNNKYGYINSEGDIVIKPELGFAMSFADNGLALVEVLQYDKYGSSTKKYGYINSQGEIAIEKLFDNVTSTEDFSNGLAKVYGGYINEKGVFFSDEEIDKSLMTAAVSVPVAVPEKAPLPTQAAAPVVPETAATPASQEPSTPPADAAIPAPAADAAPAPAADAAPAPTTATPEQLELARYRAKDALDEANNQMNGTWNAASKEIRKVVLPEQREWLKKRENDCDAKAKSDEPNNTVIQETIKFDCMTKMTYQRDGELGDQFEVLVENY